MTSAVSLRHVSALAILVLLAACNPSDRRPGLSLSGEPAAFADDWSFTDAEKEIALEVSTPYFLPHSVTIWCASLDGALYVAAGSPEEKRWPGWVDEDPDVRLLIAGKVYEGRLEPVDDAPTTERLRATYAAKYQLDASGAANPLRTVRYWRVAARG
jgi:hypothetical protein